MARKDIDRHSIETLGSSREHSGSQQIHVTAGSILTPVLGFHR